MAKASRVRQFAYGLLVLGIGGVAVYRLAFGGDALRDKLPDTPESAQLFVCLECGHAFNVTPRERMTLLQEGGRIERDEMTTQRTQYLPCPACGKTAAVPGAICPRCGKPFVRRTPDGRRHVACPNCEAGRPSRPPD
ncbi:MAG: hypothetical protein JXB13_02945 [Phycisphaerae bacterium]|nr:hypothetical protein [Phycisphaerae bacterium]